MTANASRLIAAQIAAHLTRMKRSRVASCAINQSSVYHLCPEFGAFAFGGDFPNP